MKAHIDCIPCLLNQTLRTVNLHVSSPNLQDKIVRNALEILQSADMQLSPVEIAYKIHSMIRRETGIDDPFRAIKRECNDAVLAELEPLSSWLGNCRSLERILRYVVASNMIDYGVNREFDLGSITSVATKSALAIDDSESLKTELDQARTITYFLDNAGEIVFDRLLIETINQLYEPEKIIAVVRDQPFINDALIQDAKETGLASIPNVEIRALFPRIPSGGDSSVGVWNEIQSSDVILAKGQANYEAFSALKGIYFLFLVKCEQVRKDISEQSKQDVSVGDMVVWKNQALS